MNAFPTDAHLHITVEPRLTRHLSQTIQTVELLELNAEGLYEYLAQAAEALLPDGNHCNHAGGPPQAPFHMARLHPFAKAPHGDDVHALAAPRSEKS